jgi:hypothetical protein
VDVTYSASEVREHDGNFIRIVRVFLRFLPPEADAAVPLIVFGRLYQIDFAVF